MIKTVKNIPKRILNASKYTYDGLVATAKKEESFKLELLVFAVLLIVLIFIPWPLWKKFFMVAAFNLIFFAEILNSALEDICDLISPDYHILVKHAKDKGSAAVLLAILFNFFVLLTLILI